MTGGRASRDKGARWALACRRWLETRGHPLLARPCGEDGDDLALLESPLVSVELKDIDRSAWGAAVTQADRQARPGQVPVVWAKQRGKADPGDAYLIIRAAHLPTLIDALELLHREQRLSSRRMDQGFLGTTPHGEVGSSRVDLQACKLEYSIVSPK